MTDTARPIKLTRAQLLRADMTRLLADASFRRVMYCVMMDAGILRGNFGTGAASADWSAGRRSLGLDILATMQVVDPDALLSILSEEQRTRLEASNGRRSNDDRRDELGGGSDPDGRVRNDGTVFLNYDD